MTELSVNMKTLKCNNCLNMWTANQIEPCPFCEEGRMKRKERGFRYKMIGKDQMTRRAGDVVSDRERVCEIEDGGCGKPLMGYCGYDVDDSTGQQVLVCECGHETPIWDEDRKVR